MLKFYLLVLDCSKDWIYYLLGGDPYDQSQALEAISFSIICLLTEKELGLSHNSEVQRAIWSYLDKHFFFFSSAPSGSKWPRVSVGNWSGIIWTAVVSWTDSPTVLDSKGTKQSDR